NEEGPAAGGERDRNAAHRHRQEPEESAEKDAESHEDHVSTDGRPVRVADGGGRALDVRPRAHPAPYVAAVDARVAAPRHGLADASELAEEYAAGRGAGGAAAPRPVGAGALWGGEG